MRARYHSKDLRSVSEIENWGPGSVDSYAETRVQLVHTSEADGSSPRVITARWLLPRGRKPKLLGPKDSRGICINPEGRVLGGKGRGERKRNSLRCVQLRVN